MADHTFLIFVPDTKTRILVGACAKQLYPNRFIMIFKIKYYSAAFSLHAGRFSIEVYSPLPLCKQNRFYKASKFFGSTALTFFFFWKILTSRMRVAAGAVTRWDILIQELISSCRNVKFLVLKLYCHYWNHLIQTFHQ